MDNYSLPVWIYLPVLTVFVGGAMKKILVSHLGTSPPLVAWLGAAVLAERLFALCTPTPLVLLMVLLGLCAFARRAAPPAVLPTAGKAVLVTGCDSGFGKVTAQRLDMLGFEVFATVLDLSGEGARELQRTCSSRLTLLQVDITQSQQVHQALLDTQAKLGLRGLWGLVNNAGGCVNFGDAELSLMSNYRGCMEVNFFGTLSVTKSFLPLLRQAKGRLVNVSSPAGDQPFPCLAAYGASKAALNLLTETLRHELEPWGVRVSTILPSSYKTARFSNMEYWEQQHKQLLQGLPAALLEDYGEDYVTENMELFQRFAQQANTDLSPVVNAIVQALQSPQPQPRYFAGPGIGFIYFIYSYFPFSLSNRFLQKLFVKKKLMPRALREGVDFNLKLHLQNNNNNNEEKLM